MRLEEHTELWWSKMEQRQWQEVFTIVRKYQKNMHGNSYYDSEYDRLNKVLDELYPLAYGEIPCKN